MSWIYEYIRLCCYALVVAISVFHLKDREKRYDEKQRYHLLTDLIISFGLGSSVLGFIFGTLSKDSSRNFILTPLVIIWTFVIFYKFAKK